MTEPVDDTTVDTNIVPHTTTPTWEMELLVSGGTVFGLMQLSGLMDEQFISMIAGASQETYQGLSPLWIYSKFVVLTLISTFLIHLCLRGYWVALVGMNSVYPGGVNWEKLRQGPISRRFSESTVPPMATLIEKADNLATRVFGVGFGFAMMMLIPIAVVALSLLCSFVLRKAFGLQHTQWMFIGLFLTLFVPMALTAFIDRRFGKRLAPDGRIHRLMLASFKFYDRIGLGRANNILLALFISRTGLRKWFGLVFVVIGIVYAIALVQIFSTQGRVDLGEYPGLPDKDLFARASSPSSFYASQRGSDSGDAALPYIADRIVRGPYVSLFVPYRPRRHTPMMEKHCPKALAATSDDNPRPALDCLATLHSVQLDGKPIAIRFDASDDRISGQRGMLAMIPVSALAAGRHELSLLEVHPDRDGRELADIRTKRNVTAPATEAVSVTASPVSTGSIASVAKPVSPAKPTVSAATNSDDQEPPRRYRIPFWK